MERWALVTADRRRGAGIGRRRGFALFLAGLLVIGLVLAGRSLAADPVGYGVRWWPFADALDRAESDLLDRIAAEVRADPAGLTGVGRAVREVGAQVLDQERDTDGVLLRVRFTLPDGAAVRDRCRDVFVRAVPAGDLTSRRVPCP